MDWINYYVKSKFAHLTESVFKTPEEIKTLLVSNDSETAYACYFDLDKKELKNEFFCGTYDKEGKKEYIYLPQGQIPQGKDFFKPSLTFSQYDDAPARVSCGVVSFDFDNEKDNEGVLKQVRSFVEWIDVDDIAIFYSGSKGFHVMIPVGYFPFENGVKHLPNIIKDFVKVIHAQFTYLDLSIYNYNRKFRVPYTKHEKTNLYKTYISKEELNTLTIEQIKEKASNLWPVDWIAEINPDKPREVLEIFKPIYEESKKISYEIQKERAGTFDKPSKFEAYGNKLCINKMLESRCDDVGRNNACLRLVNDLYRTGKTRDVAERAILRWIEGNGLPEKEAKEVLSKIYDKGENYNFGCQDDIKSQYCSAKCDIWKKLDPDKRPQTVDQPSSNSVNEAKIVDTCLRVTFKCELDEERGEYFGGTICKCDERTLFHYKNGYWQELPPTGADKIKRRLNLIGNSKLNQRNIDSVYKYFQVYVPTVPDHINMFFPNPTMVNFRNGTLHLVENNNGDYTIQFRNHNPNDYLTSIIDIDYDENTLDEENELFTEMLDKIFDNDEHKEEKINALSEMFGASLLPFFPHLFFLKGAAHTGKSSIMLILSDLLNNSTNMCSVEPKDFSGFLLEGMIGKLVNMVTDVDTRQHIKDNIVKQIEDRVLFSVNRKNKSIIRAPLPSVHIFGGNKLFPSFEGYSNAMFRRWTVIEFNNVVKDKSNRRNFSHIVYRHNPKGILNFAVKGLKRLIENKGFFSEIKSSIAIIKNWSELSDPVSQFITDCCEGEYHLRLTKDDQLNLKIERQMLYKAFKTWYDDAGYVKNYLISRNIFYQTLEAKGYRSRKINGQYFIKGLGELHGLDNSESCKEVSEEHNIMRSSNKI